MNPKEDEGPLLIITEGNIEVEVIDKVYPDRPLTSTKKTTFFGWNKKVAENWHKIDWDNAGRA